MSQPPVLQLDVYGPDRCERLSPEEASAWCRRLARGHYENFSVLTRLVPAEHRDDFAAIYAFCRWADDLGDEVADRDEARSLLAWWREELHGCYEGEPRHPVFVALTPVVQRRQLPMRLFDDLIRAFEQDQDVTRYETWDELLAYCRLSANPVGRLVLATLGESGDEAMLAASDAVCTALQLTNHWQDIRRDVVERDRIYIPRAMITIDDFETRLRASAARGHAVDHTFLPATRTLVRELVERTWPLYEAGAPLVSMVTPPSRPILWLFAQGGQHVLRLIEMWNYETVLHRPALGVGRKLALVATALLRSKVGGFAAGAVPAPPEDGG